MSKGAKVPLATKQRILEIFFEVSDAKDGKKATAKEVSLQLAQEHEGKVPALRTIQMILEDMDKRPTPLDKPWSIGACMTYNISPKAIPTLLSWHMWLIERGTGLTIRQACWMAVLYGVVLGKELYLAAVRYAMKERVSNALGQEAFDSSDLDIYLDNGVEVWSHEVEVK